MSLLTTLVDYDENILMPKTWIICRICLGQHVVMFDIYEKISNIYIWQMLRDCGGVPVRKNDNLPDKICEDCLKGLWKSNKFRLKCQLGNRSLMNILLERNFNIYGQEIAAYSDIVDPLEELKDAIVESLKSNELSNTNCITSQAEFNKPLKAFEDIEFLDINDDIKIKSDTSEIKKSEEIESIEIRSDNIKQYSIVQNKVKADKDKQNRIVLLLKLQKETGAKIATKLKSKTQAKKPRNESRTTVKTQRQSITKERKKSNYMSKTQPKTVIIKNSKINIKVPNKNNNKLTTTQQKESNVTRTKRKSELKTKSGSAATKKTNKITSKFFL